MRTAIRHTKAGIGAEEAAGQAAMFRARVGDVKLITHGTVQVAVKPFVRLVWRYIRLQTGAGLQPVVEVMTREATALLIEMISVIAVFFFVGLGENRWAGRIVFFHEECRLKAEEIKWIWKSVASERGATIPLTAYARYGV